MILAEVIHVTPYGIEVGEHFEHLHATKGAFLRCGR